MIAGSQERPRLIAVKLISTQVVVMSGIWLMKPKNSGTACGGSSYASKAHRVTAACSTPSPKARAEARLS